MSNDFGQWVSDFFSTIGEDPRVTATHVSLYLALLDDWRIRDSPEILEVNKSILMQHAKISARSTYDKTMHELSEFGYIIYEPFIGCGKSKVKFKKL